MDDLFEIFLQKLIPLFDDTIIRLRQEFPHVIFSRGVTREQIHISSLITDAPSDVPDLVELVVSVTGVNQVKRFFEADVIWGERGGIDKSFNPEPVDLTEENLQNLYDYMPDLINALKLALVRRRPE